MEEGVGGGGVEEGGGGWRSGGRRVMAERREEVEGEDRWREGEFKDGGSRGGGGVEVEVGGDGGLEWGVEE